MVAYYNEIDHFAAAWLRELITADLIAPGDVDTRSIEDVTPNDLSGYTQCHFFAGIGGWSHALRLAKWPDSRPVWTGSCPCQPFSPAGKGDGFADERHLWPAWFHLIRQCRPGIIFGEQVAGGDGLAWLDLVQADLKAADYACGPVDYCAAGVGAPGIRQRLWFVANSDRDGCQSRDDGSQAARHRQAAESDCGTGQLDLTTGVGRPRFREESKHLQPRQAIPGTLGMGNAVREGLPLCQPPCMEGQRGGYEGRAVEQPSEALGAGFWRGADWIACKDGRLRPVEPGSFPLAPRVPSGMGRLRGYGNAINPQVAARIIKAAMI